MRETMRHINQPPRQPNHKPITKPTNATTDPVYPVKDDKVAVFTIPGGVLRATSCSFLPHVAFGDFHTGNKNAIQ